MLRILVLLMSFLCLRLVWPASVLAIEKLPLQADPNFNVSQLSPEMQLWHDREVRGYQGVQYIDIRKCSQDGDEYGLGRCAGTGMLALATATRASGDIQFIEEIDRMLKNMRGLLKDVWYPECEKFNHCTKQTDGYLNFIWTQDPNSGLYGGDTHEMDEMLTHAGIAAGVRALKENVSIHPEYQGEVDFWVNYLEKHFLAKSKARRGINVNDETKYGTFYNRGLTHPDMSFISFYYDMYVLTGKQVYLTEANRRADVFVNQTFRVVTTPSGKQAIVWRHRTGLGAPTESLCQPLNYSRYTADYVLKLHLDGFREFANDSYMQKFSDMFTELVLPDTTATGVSPTVCGKNKFTFPEYIIDGFAHTSYQSLNTFSFYGGLMALAKWDSTGAIKNLAEAAYKKQDPSWSSSTADLKNPYAPAYIMMVLSTRSPVASPAPTPTSCPTDINNDRVTNLADYSLLVKDFLKSPLSNPRSDINGDGAVNLSDYSLLVAKFLTACN